MKALGLQTTVTSQEWRIVNSDAFDVSSRGSTGQLCASSRGNTESANVVRNYWAQSARRRHCKCRVKAHGSPVELPGILQCQSVVGESRTPGGAVKCVDIHGNANGEGN
eukprot:TRINITY_DN25_c0_g1_i2.p3 TRINITY_DN25_c0_g1~~TRINITY_DN25_c0_g1_i2.p3  ORF type:complete len:109 (-),score=2.53 TRINITY_DN25_c0_g1_i2:265-591(-)